MRFSLLSAYTCLAALGTAAPVEDRKPSQLNRRFSDSCVGHYADAVKTDPDGKLGEWTIHPWISWGIHIPGDDQYESGGCGRGFLDNFRGRCGVITNWGCEYNEGTGDAKMSFLTSEFCTAYDITQAIGAASYGELNTPCQLS